MLISTTCDVDDWLVWSGMLIVCILENLFFLKSFVSDILVRYESLNLKFKISNY